MNIIIGLGNPGSEYESTRHNIGFMVVDKLAHELGSDSVAWEHNAKLNASIVKIANVILAKPTTFMNNSGRAVADIVSFYKSKPSDVWVVHDDIDLPLGKIRIRQKGGSAGHNGVTSIMNALHSDEFVRFRLGIGRGKESTGPSQNKHLHHRSVIDFVLSRFTQHEAGDLKHLVKRGTEAVRLSLLEGIDKAMNRFN